MRDVSPTRPVAHSSQCEGKVAFKRMGIAKDAAKRRTGRVIYRCKHCFHWHVGTPERREKKLAKRDKLIRLFEEPEWNG
jgi:hypothetical protein